jgi:hypothetical protein
MSFKHIKGPLIFTSTALIFAAPVCLAEAANAQVSGADGSYFALQPGTQQLQKQQVSALGLPTGSFLGQTPQTIRSFKSPSLASITLDDVISLQSRLSSAQSQLRTLKSTPARDPQLQAQIDQLIRQAEISVQNLSSALETANTLYKKYLTTAKQLETATTQLQTAAEAEALALEQFNAAKTAYENAQETLRLSQLNRTSTEAFLNTKLENQSQAATNKSSALAILNAATLNLEEKTAAHTTIQGRYDQSLQAKNSAQQAYDTQLIPDPAWIHPTYQQERTRQVPQTTTQLTGGLQAKVYDRNGYNEAPPMPSTNETPIHTTTVPNVNYNWQSGQVLNSNRNEDVIVEFKGLISPTTSGYYRFYTPADDGTKLYINNQLLIDDWYDKGGGGTLSNPIYLEANNPVPVTLFYYENGGGAAVSFYYYTPTDGYRVVPAAWLGTQTQTTTTYITETYYTTELVPGATAPLIKDPAKLATLTAAQAELLSADEALSTATEELTSAQTAKQTASTQYASAQYEYDTATEAVSVAQANLTQAEEITSTASTEAQATQTTYETATTQYETAKTATVQATQTKQEAEAETEAAATSYQSSVVVARNTPTPDDTFTKVAQLQTKEPEPAQPTKEELPTEITAEAILNTDLSLIDPTQMTPEQAEELKEAALEIFLTAEPGSAEYEQALDALFLAAEQDDIVLDPALAAIPGLAAATELINFLGNAGADMSPERREESKKVIVTAVVAAGAAIQSAAAAAASATRR